MTFRFFIKKNDKKFAQIKTFAVSLHRISPKMQHGVLVQLVRIPACHAGGRVFESRTHRQQLRDPSQVGVLFLFIPITTEKHSPKHFLRKNVADYHTFSLYLHII